MQGVAGPATIGHVGSDFRAIRALRLRLIILRFSLRISCPKKGSTTISLIDAQTASHGSVPSRAETRCGGMGDGTTTVWSPS